MTRLPVEIHWFHFVIGIQPIADAIKAEKEIFFFLPIITFTIIANTDTVTA